MARQHSLEDLQEQYATFRRRAEPGATTGDFLAGIIAVAERWESGPLDTHRALGEIFIDLCCLAQANQLDLAHHARQAFRRMQDEYEAGQ